MDAPEPALSLSLDLDFQVWENSQHLIGENECQLLRVHRFPHLKIEM